MKAICSKRKRGGFNYIDLLIVVLTLLLFFTVALPWLARPKFNGGPAQRIRCLNNLKQVGLGFLIWATDNDGSFPMAASTNNGGSMQFNETRQVYRHFLAISNELSTPRILACPSDTQRTRMESWTPGFNNQNISYFVSLEAYQTNFPRILSGDRNITGGVLTNGNVMLCRAANVLTWTTAIHNKNGNIGLGDGSVAQVPDVGLQRQLQAEFQSVTNEVIRLAIP